MQQQKVPGISGDASRAAQLYREAGEQGDGESKRMLTAITNGGCLGSMCQLVNSRNGPRVVCDRSKL